VNYPRALPFYPAYSHLGHVESDFPVASRDQHEILSLPLYPEMTDEQQENVAEQVRDIAEAFAGTGVRAKSA
jgi:dTDP-4-amino-4,6-dideoxygalactose transaminase